MRSERPVVVSLEQALSMPYATLRMVHLGWRVIRVEATPVVGRAARGDPNRSIGRPVAGADRRSYFVAPNVGKEAIALNLKAPEGRALLGTILKELDADVFCTNTLPAHHAELGVDPATLRKDHQRLIWCSISALGLDSPDVPGYDPMLAALCGFMDLTGQADGPPTLPGPPIIDLKAGDEAFTQVLHAMLERTSTGVGRVIDISMARAAVSWLLTFLPLLDMGSEKADVARSGNEHRQFIPSNAYPAKDGFFYMAVGSDAQWARLVARAPFDALARTDLATNEGRRASRVEVHRSIGAVTRERTVAEISAVLREAGIPHAPITPIEEVRNLPFIAPHLLSTEVPGDTKKRVRLPPAAVGTAHLEALRGELPFAPGYGEHTEAVLREIGVAGGEIAALRERGVVA